MEARVFLQPRLEGTSHNWGHFLFVGGESQAPPRLHRPRPPSPGRDTPGCDQRQVRLLGQPEARAGGRGPAGLDGSGAE